MRHASVWFFLALVGVIASFACFFGGDPAPESPGVNFQATIDAALASVAASQDAEATPTASSPNANAVPTAPPTNAPSPQVIPSTSTAVIPHQPPTTALEPAEFNLSEVRNWEFAEQSDPAVVAQIRSIGWIADGLQTADEFNAAERLVNLGIDAPEALTAVLASDEFQAALRPMDLPALLSLQRMAQDRPERLAQLASAGWFRDGMTTAEAAIVAVLYERSRFQSPEFDAIVANPGTLNVELGATTNRSGTVIPIAIVRSGPAPAGTPVMAVAETAVPVFEAMFGAEFPTPAIVFHVTDYVAGVAAGTNYQTHVTLLPKIDQNAQPGFAPHAVYHEIAHYFLYAEPYWLAEGGADFAATYARHLTTGAPLESTNYPCDGATSLSELELRAPDDPEEAQADPGLWRCNYYLGERLLLSLYQQLGEERFLQAWRALYARLAEDPSYPSQREFTETDIRVEWLRAGGMQMQPELEHIWDQWYRGRTATVVEGTPDPTPVDPTLPSVNGRVDQAYVALSVEGEPVDTFSASDVEGWLYLTLKYSHSVSGDPTQLQFEAVEYFQDGFTNSRRRVTVQFDSRFAGGTQWLSLGPTPPLRFAPGRYWTYVYESGRKIAEVQFDVTP
ncbi:MAG: hypothetical protein OXF79_05245 [Chloroflexi bacterium]|nr:hypothetical protein [Chloroflexota bacterium]